MNSIEQRLIDARKNLREAQAYLSFLRSEGRENRLSHALFGKALDRLWEAQCMAEPRL